MHDISKLICFYPPIHIRQAKFYLKFNFFVPEESLGILTKSLAFINKIMGSNRKILLIETLRKVHGYFQSLSNLNLFYRSQFLFITPLRVKPFIEPFLRKDAGFSLRKNKGFSLSRTQVIYRTTAPIKNRVMGAVRPLATIDSSCWPIE